MSPVPSVLTKSIADQPFGEHNTLNNLNLDSFLKLMITELQNQDPLNPMDNSEMLAQINQIREIGATDKLTSTLDSVLLGQNLSSATGLMGADIIAVSDDGEPVSGIVDRVTVDDNTPKLHVDLDSKSTASSSKGNVKKGEYSYRVVWQVDNGSLVGVDLSGAEALKTTGTDGTDTSIQISNLPVTSGPKQIYRSNAEGNERYRLVATVTDGKKGSYLDNLSDEELSEVTLSSPFTRAVGGRTSIVSLNNISEIRPTSG